MDSRTPAADMPLGYMRQLDGLRCLAVFAVMYEHFFPAEVRFGIIWGRLGVRLFFVLSGFLITGILLRLRQQIENGRQSGACGARQFYIRRFLRIVPLFYATILIMAWLGPSEFARAMPWHFFYLSNVYSVLPGRDTGFAAHFWSLSVEEQFYLFWPWIMLWAPRRWLPAVIGLICLVGPVYRWVGLAQRWSLELDLWQTPACVDTLGAGAFLAWLVYGTQRSVQWLSRLAMGAGLVGFLLVVYTYVLSRSNLVLTVFGDVGCALFFGFVVYVASVGIKAAPGALLASTPVVYLGRISYGIYVIHYFVPFLYNTYLAPAGWHISAETRSVSGALVYVAISISLASLSWHLLEKPLNGLKRHFPYAGKPGLA